MKFYEIFELQKSGSTKNRQLLIRTAKKTDKTEDLQLLQFDLSQPLYSTESLTSYLVGYFSKIRKVSKKWSQN